MGGLVPGGCWGGEVKRAALEGRTDVSVVAVLHEEASKSIWRNRVW